jgi:hypothetical protein
MSLHVAYLCRLHHAISIHTTAWRPHTKRTGPRKSRVCFVLSLCQTSLHCWIQSGMCDTIHITHSPSAPTVCTAHSNKPPQTGQEATCSAGQRMAVPGNSEGEWQALAKNAQSLVHQTRRCFCFLASGNSSEVTPHKQGTKRHNQTRHIKTKSGGSQGTV